MDEVAITASPVAKFKKTDDGAVFPKKADEGSAGYDLYSCEDKTIKPGERALISTGLAWETNSNDLELQIRSRSGLALKHGIIVLNEPGTVDASYRGVIGVILYNAGKEAYSVKKGDRIAQGVISLLPRVDVWEIEDKRMEFTMTNRGNGGFGSTDK